MLLSDDDGLFQRYLLLNDNFICGALWSPAVLCLTFVVFAILHMLNGLLFSYIIVSGSIFGVLYFSSAHPPQNIYTQQCYLPPENWNDTNGNKLDPDEDPLAKLNLFYPPLTKSVDQLLQYFYNDFVHSWWSPLHSEYEDELERIIKIRLNAAVANVEKTLLKQERNDIVMTIMYGLANTLIIHMRECSTFEKSQVPMEVYITENPQSPFAQLLAKKEQHQQLRSLSNTILKRILPMDDMDSIVVSSIFKELLSTHLFENILATCSDPDFVNGWIVQYLSDDLDGLADTQLDSTLTNSDGLRSLVEKATEDAVAAEEQQQQHGLSPNPSSVSKQKDFQHKFDGTIGNNDLQIDNSNNITSDQYVTSVHYSFSQQGTPTTSAPCKHLQPQINYESTTCDVPMPTTIDNNNDRMTQTKTDETMRTLPMIYAYGTVSFSIMDVSPPQDVANLDKSKMTYIIQIERSALEQSTRSEGSGYVITRTYNDFDTFLALMQAKYGKRVAQLNLQLPLEVTRSWLGKKRPMIGNGGGGTSCGIGNDGEIISQGLERFLNIVVGDTSLGRDPLILAFLQKEQATEHGATRNKINFAEEYKDELASYTTTRLVVDTTPTSMGTRALSLFGRSNGSTPTSWSPSLWISNGSTSHNDSTGGIRKPASQGSISSMKSSSSNASSGKNWEENQDSDIIPERHLQHNSTASPTAPSRNRKNYDTEQQKPLSAMDIELLIETTFALIVEIFDLTTANNKAWMRRSLLNILREIVRRSYTELVAKKYNNYIQTYLSPSALVGWVQLVKDTYWPDGIYNLNGIERTLDEKKQTKQLARQLLAQRAVPGGVRQLIGDENCTLAMERIWMRLQDEELNRILVLQVLERVAKPLFG